MTIWQPCSTGKYAHFQMVIQRIENKLHSRLYRIYWTTSYSRIRTFEIHHWCQLSLQNWPESSTATVFAVKKLQMTPYWCGSALVEMQRKILFYMIYEDKQIVVPKRQQTKVLHLFHDAKPFGHPSGRRWNHFWCECFYWTSITVDCHGKVFNCVTCARNPVKGSLARYAHEAFYRFTKLDFLAINILGKLITALRNKKHILV